ncbi:MAG TPA: valine--tRNA ligase, partial [Anaerolineae bacterium]|nr:valine--tRNA ligase [Anaerolineae bacterium]
EAGRQIHDFLWGEYCDWYIEASKVRLYDEAADKTVPRAVLLHVLETALRLLHPFMPFVTEAIWQALPRPSLFSTQVGGGGEALILARWPEPDTALLDEEAEEQMELTMTFIRSVRNLRAEYAVTPGKRIPALIAAGEATQFLKEQRPILCALAKLDPNQLAIQPTIQPPRQTATIVVGDVVCYLPLAVLVDLEVERGRLSKELADVEARIARSERLLAGEFTQKAPPHVIRRERDKLTDLKATREQLRERVERLDNLR